MGTRSLKINVAGVTLGMKTGADDAEMQAITELVEEKVRAVAGKNGKATDHRVGLLAAMTIAGDLIEARRELDALREQVTERAQIALKLLDDAG